MSQGQLSFERTRPTPPGAGREALAEVGHPLRSSRLQYIIEQFLQARSLEAPDGRPLYAYRCTDLEFEAISDAVRSKLGAAFRAVDPEGAVKMAFCLWASEWWRRNHAGGHWAWETMLGQAGLGDHGPGQPYYGRLQDIVAGGVSGWHLVLLRSAVGRAFLVTLACQGGLPLQLVRNQSTKLRAYFRALLEDIRLFAAGGATPRDLAEDAGFHLPRSLRNDVVYELSGQLASAVWRLQTDIVGQSDPVAALDRENPRWRDELPVALDDDVANALLNNLIADAAEVASGRGTRIRFNRLLRADSSGFQLIGRLNIPSTLKKPDITALERGLTDVPPRFEICIAQGNAIDPVAHVTLKAGNAASTDASFAVELLPTFVEEYLGSIVAASRQLVIRSATQLWHSEEFSGSSSLSDLPWVFEEVANTPDCRWVGEGTVSVRTDTALIAVGASDIVQPSEGSSCEDLGSVVGASRRVIRLRGVARIRDRSDNVTTVRTGSDSTQDFEYRVIAPTFEIGRSAAVAYRGIPVVHQIDSTGLRDVVPTHKVQWRSAQPGSTWGPLSARCIGDGTLRVFDDGSTRFIKAVTLVPNKLALKFETDTDGRGGSIDFVGTGDAQIAIENALNVEAAVEALPGIVRLRLRATASIPADINVAIRWRHGGSATFTLPFPVNLARFEMSGFSLPAFTTVAVERLSRVRAQAMSSQSGACVQILGDYRGRDSSRETRVPIRKDLPEATPGWFEMPLGSLQQVIKSRLAFSTDEHANVRLQIDSNQASLATAQVFVHRYDFELIGDWASNEVRVPTDLADTMDIDELESIRLEAVSVLTPLAPPIPLPRLTTYSWSFEAEKLAAGPYLIVAMQGDWCRSKPFWRYVHARPDEQDVHDLVYLYEHHGSADADRVFAAKRLIDRLKENVSDPAWAVIFDQLEISSRIPAFAFDYLCALSADADAVALAAFIASDAEFKRLWRGMEQLPFWWRGVRRCAWVQAATTYVRSMQSDIVARPELAPFVIQSFDAAIARVEEMLPATGPVLARTRAQLFGTTIDAKARMFLQPEARQPLLALRSHLMDNAFNVLPSHLWGVGLPAVGKLARALDAPWLKQLLAQKPGESDSRYEVRNAPVIAALAAFLGQALPFEAAYQLRSVSELAPSWFDEVYDLTYFCAFGLDWSDGISKQLTA